MKQSRRTAAALATSSLIATGGLVATAFVVTKATSADANEVTQAAQANPALAAALHDLRAERAGLQNRIGTTQHRLAVLAKRLESQQRAVVQLSVAPLVSDSTDETDDPTTDETDDPTTDETDDPTTSTMTTSTDTSDDDSEESDDSDDATETSPSETSDEEDSTSSDDQDDDDTTEPAQTGGLDD